MKKSAATVKREKNINNLINKDDSPLEKAYKRLQDEVSERKKAENLAKAERQRFYDVLEMLPAYVVLLSPDYHVPFANRFFRERFGDSKGRRCYEYLFHRTEPCDNCETFKVFKTEKPAHWEWTGPDGRDYDIFDYPFIESDGSTLIMEMGIDITERKKAEKALSEANTTLEKRVTERTSSLTRINRRLEKEISERRKAEIEAEHLASFPEMSPNPVVEIDISGNVLYLNPTARRLFPDLKRIGKKHAFLHSWDSAVKEILNDKSRVINREVRVEDSWYDETMFYVPSSALFHLHGRDITSRILVNQELRETRDYLDNLFKYANAPIIVWDPEFRITRFNHAFERLTGRSSADVIGKKVDILVPVHGRKSALEKIKHTSLAGERWEVVEIPVQHIDGSVRIVLWNSATIIAEDGRTPIATIAQGQDITEIKRSQEALLEIQHDLSRAQTVAHVGSWRLDVRRDELLWSDESYRIFKLSPGTPMTYEAFLAAVHPDDREVVNQQWQAALLGEEYDIEHRIISGDDIRWVQEKAELDFDSDGMLRGGFGTVQDITEKKLAEERIKQIAEEWQTTFDSIADMVSIQDIDRNLVRVNRAFEIATGMKQEELVGQKCYKVLHHTDCSPEGCPHIQSINSGETCTQEIFDSGLSIHLEVTTSPILDNDGNIIGTVHVAKDITSRKKADAQITLQARMLDAIMDSIIAFDIEGRIIFWGKGASLLLGWRQEEVIGRKMLEVLVSGDSTTWNNAINKLLLTGENWSGEISVNRLDGTLAPMLIHVSPVTDENNKVIGAVAVGKDITEIKKVEQLKDEFIGLVSHELRTPLTIVNGAVKTAMDKRISTDERDMLLEDASSGVELLSNILDNLLELSRYQAARLKLDKKLVSVREFTETAAHKVHLQYPSRILEVDIPDGLPMVRVDSVRLERIIYNLVDNAFKYSSPPAPVRVYAELEKERLVIGVSDRGPGISVEEQPDLFEPFVRLGETTRRGGIGLGLVVCKRLVEAHGGHIWLESKPGEGTTFFFSIPLDGDKEGNNR